MHDEPVLNLLGALGLGVADLLVGGAESVAGHGGQTAAAIVTVGAAPGLGVGQLGSALGLSQPGAVRLVDRLEQDGLLARGPAADSRAVALRLTAAGEERRLAILAERAARLRPLLGALESAERSALEAIARKLLAVMTTDRAHADALCRLCDEASCEAHGCPVDEACRKLEGS
jgi:DNA-binding MarR family transcriptional regulator